MAQLRRAFDLTGCAFLMVDWEERYIRPAAAWFSTPAVGDAFGAVLSRPYDPERPGITEAAIERRAPLLVSGIEEWPGAPRLRRRLDEELPPEQARHTWEWYVASSLLSVPVYAPGGRILGVLAMSSTAFTDDDLRGAEVFANLAGIALDRSELLHREELRSHERAAAQPGGPGARPLARARRRLPRDRRAGGHRQRHDEGDAHPPGAGQPRPAGRPRAGRVGSDAPRALRGRRGHDRPRRRDRRAVREPRRRPRSVPRLGRRGGGLPVVRAHPAVDRPARCSAC